MMHGTINIKKKFIGVIFGIIGKVIWGRRELHKRKINKLYFSPHRVPLNNPG
jgi:hypothetical protein